MFHGVGLGFGLDGFRGFGAGAWPSAVGLMLGRLGRAEGEPVGMNKIMYVFATVVSMWKRQKWRGPVHPS